ncbi:MULTISPECIES: SusC/RagA family TonB-linked outer membrane protein [unclassified Carboxylicivirga]|uniref:SusC/RagA family TonB-linked outer membrane protein n=1 Tax=Carboxylicivirga TaxID=1628153 RepID=UPI003D33B21B
MKKMLHLLMHSRKREEKWMRVMKLTSVFLLAAFIQVSASVYSQGQKVTIKEKGISLEQLLWKIQSETRFVFVFSQEHVSNFDNLEVNVSGDLEDILNEILVDKGLTYEKKNDAFIIKKAPPVVKQSVQQPEKNVTITGKVTDQNGVPLPGVAVMLENTTIGTATDINGEFALQYPSDQEAPVLFISMLGFDTVTELIGDKSQFNITLSETISGLNEVVVTGYQTISKERSTGSYSIVDEKELETQIVSDITTALEGKVAGLNSYKGELVIRGKGTFGNDNSPLVVVDGIPTASGFSAINVHDIESVTVLKDAAAASIYGAKSANGVVVVTTKKAKKGTTEVDFSADWTVTDKPDLDYFNYASSSDVIDYELYYLKNNPHYQENPISYFNTLDTEQRVYSKAVNYYKLLANGEMTQNEVDGKINALRGIDYRSKYRDEVYQNPLRQQYNLTFRNAGEKSNLVLSANATTNKLLVQNENNGAYNFYLKNQLQLTDWFSLSYGGNLSFNKSKNHAALKGMTDAMPYEQMHDADGNPLRYYKYNFKRLSEIQQIDGMHDIGYNVLEELDKDYRKTNKQNIRLFIDANVKLFKGLSYSTKFQYETIKREESRYAEKESFKMREMINRYAVLNNQSLNYYVPNNGALQRVFTGYDNYTFRNQLNFDRTFSEDHNVTAIVGTEIMENSLKYQRTTVYGYDDKILSTEYMDWEALVNGVPGELYNLNSQRLSPDDYLNEETHRFFSMYANAAYTLRHKYNFTASVRVDQADLFGSDPKYRYRPLWSFGAGWNLSEEDFLSYTDWLNMLKLRGSYGVNGHVDQSTSPYLLASLMNNYKTGNMAAFILSPPNALLRWEKTSTYNIGVDFAMFNNRLIGALDAYYRKSTDLLANKKLDPATGFPSAKVNNGAMTNRGFELSIAYDWFRNNDFSWNTSLVYSHNKNEIDKVNFEVIDGNNLLKFPKDYYLEGEAFNSIYAFRYAGLTDEGDPSVYDADGNVVANDQMNDPDAMVRVGQIDPVFNGSVNNHLRYKNLELSALVIFYGGHKLRQDVTPLYDRISDGNIHKDVANAWTPENTDTNIPRMATYSYNSFREAHWKYADIHVKDADFIKLRNVTLAYSLPEHIAKKFHARHLQIKGQVTNPLYWSAAGNNIDPEAYMANNGYRLFPQMPSWSVGVKLGF